MKVSNMESHHITVPKTARYYTLGNPGKQIKKLWVVCHGYGQAANRFIRKFDAVFDDETFIIAPEALSRFYWKDFTGDVVASWMTREDRHSEIEDYTNYLDAILKKYLPQLADDVQVHIFGFSQGVATVMRWVHNTTPSIKHLIVWAGRIPEDVDYKAKLDYWQDKKVEFLFGDKDEYLTPDRMAMITEEMKAYPFEIDVTKFEGEHRIYREELSKLNTKLHG